MEKIAKFQTNEENATTSSNIDNSNKVSTQFQATYNAAYAFLENHGVKLNKKPTYLQLSYILKEEFPRLSGLCALMDSAYLSIEDAFDVFDNEDSMPSTYYLECIDDQLQPYRSVEAHFKSILNDSSYVRSGNTLKHDK